MDGLYLSRFTFFPGAPLDLDKAAVLFGRAADSDERRSRTGQRRLTAVQDGVEFELIAAADRVDYQLRGIPESTILETGVPTLGPALDKLMEYADSARDLMKQLGGVLRLAVAPVRMFHFPTAADASAFLQKRLPGLPIPNRQHKEIVFKTNEVIHLSRSGIKVNLVREWRTEGLRMAVMVDGVANAREFQIARHSLDFNTHAEQAEVLTDPILVFNEVLVLAAKEMT